MVDGQALLAILDSQADPEMLRAALDEIQALLEPLLELGRVKNVSLDALRPVARTVGPLVTSLVRSVGVGLCPKSPYTPEQLQVLGDAACLGLNALDCLRPVIKASRHELEVQRYNFVRKLASLGLYKHAMAQGKVLHSSTASSPGTMAGPGDLHIAAVANLLICYSEMAQTNSRLAEDLWNDVWSPVECLLALAREAVDVDDASKRLEPVLKCLSRVAETLHNAGVIRGLSCMSIAQQLKIIVLYGELCRQEESVQQMLLEEAMSADEAVQIGLVEGLLYQLTTAGSLPSILRSVLHQVALSLVQRRVMIAMQPASGPYTQHPLGVVVRTALHLPSCLLPQPDEERLRTVLDALGSAAMELNARPNASDCCDPWLTWCCLDILRLSTSSVLVQLVSAPQSTGGNLSVLARLMELLGTYSLRHDAVGVSCMLPVVPSGCSAITMAVRLQATHCLHAGQLSRLSDDIARALDLLGRLLERSAHGSVCEGEGGLSPLVLQSISASLSNSGLDLLQAQNIEPAAQLLQAAADFAIKRALHVLVQGALCPETELVHLVKKCKAHVAALQQLSKHTVAMATIAQYVVHLQPFMGNAVYIVAPLIKLYVRSSIAAAGTSAAVPGSAAAPVAAPAHACTRTSAAPAAPCKARRRGGRAKPTGKEDEAQQSSLCTTTKYCGSDTSVPVQSGGPSTVPPATLVQSLTSAVAEGCAPPGLLNVMDMYAIKELEVISEEAKRQLDPDAFHQKYTSAVLCPLLSSADKPGCSALKARALLVRALTGSADRSSQLTDLHAGCSMFDVKAFMGARSVQQNVDGPSADLGLLDSAALAYAQLGLCLAQGQFPKHACPDKPEAIVYVIQALTLWEKLLDAHEGRGTRLILRMPHATLHTILQVQQFLHLYGEAHPRVPRILGQIVGAASSQVKLREQHAYLLCISSTDTTCVTWVIAPRPCPLLADAVPEVQKHSKLADILKVLDPIRQVCVKGSVGHSLLASTADTCALELECSAFLRHGPTPMLLRSQYHQVAAAAYIRAGNTAEAHVHAQEALRITFSLFAQLECPLQPCGRDGAQVAASNELQTASPTGDLTPSEAAAAVVKSGVEASASDYAVDEDELESQDEVSADSRQPVRVAAPTDGSAVLGSRCNSLGIELVWAIAASHMASLHQAARVFEVAGCVEDAMCLWKECSRTADLFSVPGVLALCCNHLAELSCRRMDTDAAKAHIQAASVACRQVEAVRKDAFKSAHLVLLSAHMHAAQSRLALAQKQDSHAVQAGAGGIELCNSYLQGPSACKSEGLDNDGQPGGTLWWQAICLRSQLIRLHSEALIRLGRRAEAIQAFDQAKAQLKQAAFACSSQNASAVWPIDYGLLLSHRSSAATTQGSLSLPNVRIVGLQCNQSAFLALGACTKDGWHEGVEGTNGVVSRADQWSKKGARAKRCVVQPKIAGNLTCTQSQRAAPGTQASAPHRDINSLLLSLQLCWQVPLAAGHACRQLMRACMTLGLPNAASMFLHLGHGASYAQQQELQGRLMQHISRRVRQPSHPTCIGGTGSDGCAKQLPERVRDAAFQMIIDVAASGSSFNVLTAALEQGAARWLSHALEMLPADTVVSSILQDTEMDQMIFSRLAFGRMPLLVSLGSCSLDAPSSCNSASCVLDGCLSRLHRLLNESGDSMRIDQDAAMSQSHKAKWWKTRTALDSGISELLRDLDVDCLGPWRCLLLPKPDPRHQELHVAVDAFITECFLEASEASEASHSCTLQVLRELLGLAMAHMQHLQGPDLSVLMQEVCRQLHQPVTPSHVTALATKFAAAEAAARMQLLILQPVGTASGAQLASSHQAFQPPCTTSSGCRNAGVAASKESKAFSARTYAIAPSVRTRPGAGRTHLAVGKTSSCATGRRAGVETCNGDSMVLDDDDAAPSKPLAVPAPSRRGLRAPRLVALQTETDSAALKDTRHACPGQRGRSAASALSALDAETTQASTPASVESAQERPGSQHSGPVLLVLGPTLHALPWESIPCCRGREHYRILSLPVACATAACLVTANACGGLSSPGSPSNSDVNYSDKNRSFNFRPVAAGKLSAYYVLNPSGDLEDTQRSFQPILEAEPGWQGLIGIRPDARTLTTALQSHDLFLYFGHGSGEQFLPLPALRKLKRCAACLLMGCSSGRLRLHGAYDPVGAAASYLLSGCPALVANLWDVTDRDIDRFCQALMHSWLGCSSSPLEADDCCGNTNSCSRGHIASAAHRKLSEKGKQLGILASSCRNACKLMHLTGAAPVCYGLPLGWK